MAGRKTVSMQDLADMLGISKVTVSKALNGKDGVSEELKEKIFRIAEQYEYVLPHYGSRKAKKVGIIMSERFNAGDEGRFYMGMYEKIIYELRRASCSSMMISPNRDSLTEDIQTVSKTGIFDGLIFLGILDKEVRKRMDAINLPKVFVDVYDETHKSDSVVTENIYSTYEMTRRLILCGHRQIGFVGTVGSTTSISDRYLGYARAMLEQGLELRDSWRISDRKPDNTGMSLDLPDDLPTALVSNCDETAFYLAKELSARGIRIPDDISITGFDNSIYAQLCSPPLTTVAVDIDEIGRVAAKQMIRHMEEPDRKGGEVFRVPGRIICRDSVRNLSDSSVL